MSTTKNMLGNTVYGKKNLYIYIFTYPFVDGKQMRFLESFATFFTTVGFIVFSGIIVFFVLGGHSYFT